MEINADEARLISRALAYVAQRMAEELGRITESATESDYIKEAAAKQYNEDVQGFSELHVKLVNEFPELTQR